MSASAFFIVVAIIAVVIVSVILACLRVARRPNPYGGCAEIDHRRRDPAYRTSNQDHNQHDGSPCDWCGLPVADDQTVRVELEGMTMHSRCMQDYKLWSDALGQVVKP